MPDVIEIRGARLHNLKNVDLDIPKERLVVITGVSGSGKSSLALETLHKEALRQFFEAIGLVTFGLSKPHVDSIRGLSPSISIDQYLSNRSPRSTVGTATEVFSYLRLLYARIGRRICMNCGAELATAHDGEVKPEMDEESGVEGELITPCPQCGHPVTVLSMGHFSFNKPEGACPTCTGLGVTHGPNLDLLIDGARSVSEGGVVHWSAPERARYASVLEAAARHYNFAFDARAPLTEMGLAAMDLLLYGAQSERFRRHFPGVNAPATVSGGRFEGIVPNVMRRHAESKPKGRHRARLAKLLKLQTCPECEGQRLRAESRAVTVEGVNIVTLSQMSLTALTAWLADLEKTLRREEESGDRIIAAPVIVDLQERLRRLLDVGLGYLTLQQDTPTLSNGEEMRLRLAALLGSSLTGMLYVLDEPTIGLHPRDNALLIGVLRRLRDLGNTVLVIEHDLQMMRAADVLIDMGPGAGQHGGEVAAMGTPQEVAQTAESLTGQYLSGRKVVPQSPVRRQGNGQQLVIESARAHNLKNVTVAIPLGTLTAVIGSSGSGKSSLVIDTLGRAAAQRFQGAQTAAAVHDAIRGWEQVDDVVMIDQTPIGRSPRSNAATYTDVFTVVRQTFAALPEAKGMDPRHFSFNVPGGRCERCEGAGVLTVQMHFLPAVEVRCPQCGGARFQDDVLQILYRGANIAEVLDATVDEARELFADVPAAARRLELLADVGLGYLKLGQPATAISGGEAQRIKLAKELGRRSSGPTLYLLDEPTTGQHPHDVARLLAVLQRLVDAGHTVVVIEHNLELIAAADWLIELGPEGGDEGGYLIAQGTPEQVMAAKGSVTASYLRHTLLPLGV